MVESVNDEGLVEVGLGDPFQAIVEGQDAALQLGAQGLWMFIANAQVRDMDVGTGARRAAVDFTARLNGTTISIPAGCRDREFAMSDGQLYMVTPFIVALDPSFTGQLAGATVTLTANIRDREGRNAAAESTVVARFPR